MRERTPKPPIGHPEAPRFLQRGTACPEQAKARRRGFPAHGSLLSNSANSLFCNILRLSPLFPGFCRRPRIPAGRKSLKWDILRIWC